LWDGDLEATLDFFAGVDVIVGFRLHSCILALSAGTPFIMIDPYHSAHTRTSKMREFAVQCGLERFYFTLADLLAGRADVRRAAQDAKDLGRGYIAAVRERLAAELGKHFDRLAGMVLS
jgi:polysaccharide pyruvyl transferase WcaK-like protein